MSVQWHIIHLLYSASQSGGIGKKLFQTLVVLHQILLNLFTEASRANCSGSVSHHGWYSSFGSHRTWMQCPKWGRDVTVILSAHLTFLQSEALQPPNHTDTGCCSCQRRLRWVGTGGISSYATLQALGCLLHQWFTDQVRVSEICTPRNLLWMSSTAVLLRERVGGQKCSGDVN